MSGTEPRPTRALPHCAGPPNRGRTVLAALLGFVLLASGCATIPDKTQPEVVKPAKGADRQLKVPSPESGLDPIAIVREYIMASGQPLGEHAYARVYLGPEIRKSWSPSGNLTIIEDSFNTVPADEQPKAKNERAVLLTGSVVGTLGSDSAFIPSTSDEPLNVRVTLRRQANGEWRILDPPAKVITTKSAFVDHYFQVPVYFFAHNSATLVPDLRYVPLKPRKGLPSKVVDLLLDGPSSALQGAVRNPLGGKAALESNVDSAPDGALAVPLSGVQGKSKHQKKLMVAQLVTSLQQVQTFRVRPLSQGEPLIDGKYTWRASDLPAYGASSSLSSEVSGVLVLKGRVRSLADGEPVPGVAGTGAYDVVSAGVSMNGRQLAVVEQTEDGVRLRIGPIDGAAEAVELRGPWMTPPTWLPPASAESASHTVWTVVGGDRVVRVQRTPEGGWAPQKVDASSITEIGTITELRLSRDGTRVAAVVGGMLVIASVVRDDSNSVTLRSPRLLRSDTLTKVIDVAWAGQHRVVAATSSSAHPVVRLPIDGLRMDRYSTSSLTLPVRGIAAAPSRPVIAADQRGMSKVSSVTDPWRPHEQSRSGAVPFYPG